MRRIFEPRGLAQNLLPVGMRRICMTDYDSQFVLFEECQTFLGVGAWNNLTIAVKHSAEELGFAATVRDEQNFGPRL